MRRVMAVLALAGLAGMDVADAATIKSTWAVNAVAVDGALNEWEALEEFEDGAIGLGVRNDGTALYVAISTKDALLAMRLLSNGLTLRIDPPGSGTGDVGVKFPVGGQSIPRGEGEEGGFEAPDAPPDRSGASGRRGPDPEALAALADRMGYELEWREGTSTRRLGVDDAATRYGLDAALSTEGGGLTIELRIPLASSAGGLAGIGITPGQTIDLRLDSPGMEPPHRRGGGFSAGGGPRMGGGPPGGGRGGPPGGGRGGPPGGARITGPIEIRTKVRTAAEA